MNVDYIIVGLGLAGIAFATQLEKYNKSFVVFEDNSQNSSLVAGGMYNPVVLKRFTPVWNAKEQLEFALPHYQNLEKILGEKLLHKVVIYRIFKSIEEQNNWFFACDKQLLKDFMNPKIVKNENEYIKAPFGFGTLNQTGRMDVKRLVDHYRALLIRKNKLLQNKFCHENIQFKDEKVIYKNIKSKNLVFCEGFGIKSNPFFNKLPMREAKGELITIHAPKLKVDFLIKAAVFVLPIGDDRYKVGATFNWNDKSEIPTEEGKNELIRKLNSFIKCDYSIVEHTAGIRPTIIDRRPLLGRHPVHKQLAILNGLGTRGVMIAPLMARKLYQFIENGNPLEKEISIERF